MAPAVVEHGHAAEEAGRMRVLRSAVREARQLGDAPNDAGVPRFLERDDVGLCCRDHLGQLLGAANAALADVIGEEPHVRRETGPLQSSSSSADFSSSTRYG